MKKIRLSLLALIAMVGLATGVIYGANDVHAQSAEDEKYQTVIQGDSDSSIFKAGQSVQITGTVNGDVYVAGQDVIISGDVKGDVLGAAQTLTVSGKVEGNIRVAAQTTVISGTINGSVSNASQTFVLNNSGSIKKDAVIFAQSATIDGTSSRDVFSYSQNLVLNGTISRNLTYDSDTSFVRSSSSVINGSIFKKQVVNKHTSSKVATSTIVSGIIGTIIYAVIAFVIIMLVAGLLIPKWLENVTDRAFPMPWKAALVGLVTNIVTPVILGCIFITIIGVPLALLFLLVWAFILVMSFTYGAYYIGRLIFRNNKNRLLNSVTGGVILSVLLIIPIVNIISWIVIASLGTGVQILSFAKNSPYKK
jgi:cytoskeletal protein CcmA (bactofilin family)